MSAFEWQDRPSVSVCPTTVEGVGLLLQADYAWDGQGWEWRVWHGVEIIAQGRGCIGRADAKREAEDYAARLESGAVELPWAKQLERDALAARLHAARYPRYY